MDVLVYLYKNRLISAMPEQIPEETLQKHFQPEDLGYMAGLYHEALDIGDVEKQQTELQAVAELVGDLALFEALGEMVNRDREVVQRRSDEFKSMRAETAGYKMEARGYAFEAPRLKNQVQDESRSTEFTFNRMPMGVDPDIWPQEQMTEHEGLYELDSFLTEYQERNSHPWSNTEGAKKAKSLQENLTFIGQNEFEEAARGIASNWKQYLQQDPDRKICVLTAISDSEKYPGIRKSDEFLRDQILQNFSDEELEAFSGRIVDTLDDIQNDKPEDVRLILLDDWTISGQQMRRAYQDLKYDPYFIPYKDSLEVQLITASEDRIQNGLQIDPEDPDEGAIKVSCYFKSHHVADAATETKSYTTGLHSSVNYGFEDILEDLISEDTKEGETPAVLALASIVRTYSTKLVQPSAKYSAEIKQAA